MNHTRLLTPPPVIKSLSKSNTEEDLVEKNISRVHFQSTSLTNMGRAFTHPLIQVS